MQVWNLISEYQVELLYAADSNNDDQLSESAYKIYFICSDNLPEAMAEKIGYSFDFDVDDIVDWVLNNVLAITSSFGDQEYIDSYYTEAIEILAESEAVLAEEQEDNKKGDTFNPVTVIYSVVLFMLGIVGTFRRLSNRMLITGVAIEGGYTESNSNRFHECRNTAEVGYPVWSGATSQAGGIYTENIEHCDKIITIPLEKQDCLYCFGLYSIKSEMEQFSVSQSRTSTSTSSLVIVLLM